MTAEIRQLETVPGPGRVAAPQLRTLVVCDIADSTALVERMGDQSAANIIRKHDRLARALIERHQGREIDKTDGFLLLFDRPIQAAAFALDYQRALKHMSAAEGVVVRARVGIHMGDVVIWENSPEDVARGAKPIEVEGLVKPIAARLAQLARPQQTLMSFAAAGIAHRAEGELGREATVRVHWKDHGRYRFKGLPEPIEVIEVGEDDVAPLHAPKSVRTARKILPWWRRPLTLAAEAVVLAIGIGVGTWMVLQSPPTLAFGARDWVVVGDLHNLTGDKVFDQSVDSALRISLEQSQYVNVLPQLSVQQTLQRMELNPAKADVNRSVGSQVALRDGARALILPTVADVDGRISVTAEVVDPNTEATVYSVSASGNGDASVLPSLDSVSKQLRGKLGEALSMVSKQSMPLAKVATPDLNALRAYSLGESAYNAADFGRAQALFGEALKIDPHFALAEVQLAKILIAEGNDTAAMAQMESAHAHRARLAPRENLYVDAWLANYVSPDQALEKWRLLTSVYPDYFEGLGAYAFFLWNDSNDFAGAAPYFRQSFSPKNPHTEVARYMLGAMYLEADQYARALQAFTQVARTGFRSPQSSFASAYAAQREFGRAASVLKHAGMAGATPTDWNLQLAIQVDQGRWPSDEQYPSAPAGHTDSADLDADRYAVTRLSLQALDGTPRAARVARLTAYVSSVRVVMQHADVSARSDLRFQIALVAYLAARAGDVALARRALLMVAPADYDSQVQLNMRGVALAEVDLASGDATAAIAALKGMLSGRELCITHAALMDAYASAGNDRQALVEAKWLATHRGRAYLEASAQQQLSPFNVAQSDLALLSEAQFSLAVKDSDTARSALAAFARAWPGFAKLPFAARRYAALVSAL